MLVGWPFEDTVAVAAVCQYFIGLEHGSLEGCAESKYAPNI